MYAKEEKKSSFVFKKKERKRKEQQRSIMVDVLGLLVCFSILGGMALREKNMTQSESQEAGDSITQTPDATENEKEVGGDAAMSAEPESYEAFYRAKIKKPYLHMSANNRPNHQIFCGNTGCTRHPSC